MMNTAEPIKARNSHAMTMITTQVFAREAADLIRMFPIFSLHMGSHDVLYLKSEPIWHDQMPSLSPVQTSAVPEMLSLDVASLETSAPAEMDDGCAQWRTSVASFAFEYHIVWSLAFSVPVLYFTVCDAVGCPVTDVAALADILPDIEGADYRADGYPIVTLDEHPALNLPFFQLHPCNTASLMAMVTATGTGKKFSYLRSWLSLVGPKAGLRLSLL